MAEPPRLFVDVSEIIKQDAQSGIQRVVRAIWSELRRRDGQNFTLAPVYATRSQGYCHARIDFLDQPTGALSDVPVRARQGDIFLGLDLAAGLLPKYREQIREWRAQGASIHIVVYDLLPLTRPEWFTPITGVNFRKWFNLLAEQADHAICISNQVASEVKERLGTAAERRGLVVRTIQLGGDIAASSPSKDISLGVKQLLERLRFRPSILMVGTVEPRKGHDCALAAFDHLWSKGDYGAPDLVIVGKGGWKTANLQERIRSHPEQGKRLHWLEGVSDEGLCQLYKASNGMLVASHGEGFGLPLLEAAMHDRPVLARSLPVFQEQRLPNISYFEDDSPEQLGSALLNLSTIRQGCSVTPSLLPKWSDSVDGLLNVLGLDPNPATETSNVRG